MEFKWTLISDLKVGDKILHEGDVNSSEITSLTLFGEKRILIMMGNYSLCLYKDSKVRIVK